MTKSSAKPPGGLDEYRRKRDPGATLEPFSAERTPSAGETRGGRFVVHLHDATRRHYDLRIEVGGVLMSFAIPRDPSLDIADKRLAMNTEHHPIEYLEFEDVIPEGNYGAGPMIVWDIGRVRYLETSAEEGVRIGKIDFQLAGHKLKGRFALVATGRRKGADAENQWLFFKKGDEYARAGSDIVNEQPRSVLSGLEVEQLASKEDIYAELLQQAERIGGKAIDPDETTRAGAAIQPMLCSIGERADLRRDGYLYELKLDGVRIIADRDGADVTLRYRKGRLATSSYPEIARAVRALASRRVVLDGEIVTFDERGRPRFPLLAPRIHASRPFDVERAAALVPVTYLVFDVLRLGDLDLTDVPLIERKRLLAQLVPGKGLITFVDHLEEDGRPLFGLCEQQELEGVVAKRAASRYRSSTKRSDDWIKIKLETEEDFVVVAWCEGRTDATRIGALEVATYAGDTLVLRGRVGSGLDVATSNQLLPFFEATARETSAAVGEPMAGHGVMHHVEPRVVVRVRFLEWSPEGRLRMPVLVALKLDAAPRECVAAPTDELFERATADDAPAPRVASAKSTARRVRMTNRDKVFWPDEGITKGELLDYYAAVSDVLLPHLAERPVMLVRHPDGIAGKSFYQWNVPQGTPDWVETLQLRDEESSGKDVATFLVNSADALLHIINLGCIPVHVLACLRSNLDRCDFLTIDLDIGEQPFSQAILVARTLRQLLDDLKLVGFPKTSGQSGLHILIPMRPAVPFPVAKILVELIGRLLQGKHADVATMERRVSERGGRLYIDTGQTGRSRTIVSPYSVRAHPGARVSTPLDWDEVHLALDPARFTIFTVPERTASRGDPMAELLTVRTDFQSALSKLEKWLRP